MSTSENRVYAVLNEDSKSEIIEKIPQIYPKLYLEHLTLDFNGDLSNWRNVEGNIYKLVIDKVASNEEIQAIIVDLSNVDIKSINLNPHITYSAKEDVKPFRSNAMLESDNRQIITFPPLEIITQIKIEIK
jgi:Fungal tRNA ligase phosphodiesterase domain